jgi:hypothetical protein
MLASESKTLHGAYIRLTEKFKALWTFHQFLRGVHQTFLGDVPAYKIDFNSMYERLREIASEVMSVAPSETLKDKIDKIETELGLTARTLRLSDRALSPSLVRRFFDKVRPQDEKIVYHLLRFYFSQPDLDPDIADKIDFLATIAATAPGAEGLIPRDFADALSLFEAITANCPWPEPNPETCASAVQAFQDLSNDVSRASSFESLISDKLLDNVRTLKHRLGVSIAHPKVLAATAICNVKTKAVFRRLFEEEKKRIQEASSRIEDLEREFAKGGQGAVPEEFARFRSTREEFQKREGEANVRARDVLALKNSITELLGKFDLGQVQAEEIEDALEITEGPAEASESGRPEAIANAVHRILSAVEMGDGTNPPLRHLGLEPAELRAARRVIAGGGKPSTEQDAVVLEAAALRVKAEEEANRWRQGQEAGRIGDNLIQDVRETLSLASETDRRFARLIQDAAEDSQPEEMNSLIRSRFRLLHAYSGLWLLQDSRTSDRITQG